MFDRADLKSAQPNSGRGHKIDTRKERGSAAKGLLRRIVNNAAIENSGG